jgi:hypothetical protein
MVATHVLLVSALFTTDALAQTAVSEAETALNVLQAWYNESSGLWNSCGWWNGANCMTVLADLAKVDSSVMNTAVSVFENTWVNGPSANPGEASRKSLLMEHRKPSTLPTGRTLCRATVRNKEWSMPRHGWMARTTTMTGGRTPGLPRMTSLAIKTIWTWQKASLKTW